MGCPPEWPNPDRQTSWRNPGGAAVPSPLADALTDALTQFDLPLSVSLIMAGGA
jgi:hypothetical protein